MAPVVPAGDQTRCVVVGAGPAGLTAAYELTRRGLSCVVLEADDVVGGISRTVERDGWRFDIGGHRFFTKVSRVERFWWEILGQEDFLLRPRMSRIGKVFCIQSVGWRGAVPARHQPYSQATIGGRTL